MIWRIGSQFLVQREDVFSLVERTGNVAHRYAPSITSSEDELHRTHFVVAAGELREHTTIERWGAGPRVSFTVRLEHLVADTTAETARFVATALGDDAVVQEERRLGLMRAAEARVAAIDGACADLARGPHIARAQAALRQRVQRWADDEAAGLLITLIDLARAEVAAHGLAAFATGCLHACFAHDVPDLLDGPIVAHPLAARCAAHARVYERAAEAQAWIDAPGTAAAFQRASIALMIAAELLGYCSTTGS